MNIKPLVYVESSVISYLAAKPSNDLVASARQSITTEWWENQSPAFVLCVSDLVVQEISAGHADAAQRRRALLGGLAFLDISDVATVIAQTLLDKQVVPKGSENDALHIGIAAAQGADYLLTWNFRHINNAAMKQKVAHVIEGMGFICPVLCSPEELGGAQ